jgi:hypothetical protein
MWPRKGKLTFAQIVGVLIVTLVALAGCAGVEVVDTTPAATTPGTFASPLPVGAKDHNLAVLTVEFDPPLNYQQLIIRRQSVTLLVAVENLGDTVERDVTVRAELSSPENPDLFLTQGASVVSIAPGEIQVVRFSRLGEIPYHQAYHLEVVVDPVAGERDLSDNQKAFDIQIHQK